MYFPLTCLTHGSILKSPTKTEDMFVKEMDFPSLPLTDIGNVSQAVIYKNATKKFNKKAVIGCQIPISMDDSKIKTADNINDGNIILYCKTLTAWKELLKIFFYMNHPDRLNIAPRISAPELCLFNLSEFACVTCDVGIKNSKFLKKCFHHIYSGFSPYENWRQVDGIPKVVITPNACLSPGEIHILSALRKKESRDFGCKDYDYIHTEGNLIALGVNKEYISNTMEIFESVEDFEITNKQELPKYHGSETLEQLCEKAMSERGFAGNKIYEDRLKTEISSINIADMSGYFLVVSDIIRYLKSSGRMVGIARGSAGGCLVSYLLKITELDPIKYGLMFERFYSPDRGGLPDIDIDIPPDSRDSVYRYVHEKYGQNNFAQLATFNTLKGSSALKHSLTISGVAFGEQNDITKVLPKENKIDPELKLQQEKTGSRSLILWKLLNEPKDFEKWCILKEDGSLEGKYSKEFDIAIRLDKVIHSRGRHASAFALSNVPLYEKAPVAYDNVSGELIVDTEMVSCEELGLVKLDLLGLDLLSKAEYVRKVLENGNIRKSRYW